MLVLRSDKKGPNHGPRVSVADTILLNRDRFVPPTGTK